MERVAKIVEVVDLLERREIALWVEDLVEREYKLRARLATQMLLLWEAQLFDLCLHQAVLLFILRNLLLSLRHRHVVTRVYYEIVFPLHIGALLFYVVSEYSVQVHVEAHELGETLLSEQPLRLQIHLRDSLGRQAALLHDGFPFADAEFHEGDLQDVDLFLGPTWRERVVVQALRVCHLWNRRRRGLRSHDAKTLIDCSTPPRSDEQTSFAPKFFLHVNSNNF